MGLDFDLPGYFDRESVTARLAAGRAGEADSPLFTTDRADHVSKSPFADNSAMSNIAVQNPALPAPPSEARFIVAGQQPGLLTGPLYTFLKAVTAISAAQALSGRANRPVLPLFWVASEDHDVLEVNRVTVAGRRFVHEYPREIARGAVPQVGDISIMDAREPILEFLRETLHQTEFKQWVMDMVSACDYSSYASAFSDLTRSLFAEWELRTVDPRTLRPLTAPVLAALVDRWADVVSAIRRGTEDARSAGFDPPLEAPGIYEIVDGCRVPLGIERQADEIRRRPEDFSPNAALRPVLQDAVLPVTATVAGPSEVAYLWQIRPIYGTVGVTPSLILPRISATFVEEKIRSAAEKAGLTAERIFETRAMYENYSPREDDDPSVAEVEEKTKALLEAVERAGGDAASKPLARNKKALASDLEKLVRRVREEKLEKAGLGRKLLEKISDAVLPEGKPQERVVNVLQFLNLYGPDLVRLSVDTLDPFRLQHRLVMISAGKED